MVPLLYASVMISTADVVMESFRPGVMTRLGLGYDAVREINPRAIHCRIAGYDSLPAEPLPEKAAFTIAPHRPLG